MRDLSCAFTGNYLKRFRFGYNEHDEKCIRLKAAIKDQIAMLVDVGVYMFYSGMALGVDTWAAEIVLDMKKEHPHLRLTAVLHCETMADSWTVKQRERHFNILAMCDEVVTLQSRYTRTCLYERERFLVDCAGTLLAVYDGSERGTTAYTVRYGKDKNSSIISIHPDTMAVESTVDFDEIKQLARLQLSLDKEE